MEDEKINSKYFILFILRTLTVLFGIILFLPKESDRGWLIFDPILTIYLIGFLIFILVYTFVLIPIILKKFKVPGKFSFSQLFSVICFYGIVLFYTTLLIALSYDYKNVAYYEEIIDVINEAEKVYYVPIYTLELLAYIFLSISCITLLWLPYYKKWFKFLKYELLLIPFVLIIFQFYIYGGSFLSNEVRLDKEKIEKNEDRYYNN